MASARATAGGPRFEWRTPSSAASFQSSTTLSPVFGLALTPTSESAADADKGTGKTDEGHGKSRSAPPAPTRTRNSRRESAAARTPSLITCPSLAAIGLSVGCRYCVLHHSA